MAVVSDFTPEFMGFLNDGTYQAVGQVAIEFQRDCQRRVNIGNDKGWLRSQAGNPPHHAGETGPYRHIGAEGNRAGQLWRVGVPAEKFHMLYQEKGTKPHAITAVNVRMLRIPWRAEGQGRREPTAQEILDIGLRWEYSKKSGENEWVYYRRTVKHPGQQARPWLSSTLRLGKAKYAAIVAKLGSYKLTTQRGFNPEPPQ